MLKIVKNILALLRQLSDTPCIHLVASKVTNLRKKMFLLKIIVFFPHEYNHNVNPFATLKQLFNINQI